MPDAVDGNRTFIESFEQSRLRAGSCPVEFVDEQHVCEHRARNEDEAVLVRIPDCRPGDVARQQISRALDPAEGAADRARERAGQRGLATARDVLHEDMSTRKKAGCDQLDSWTASMHDLLDVGDQARSKGCGHGARRGGFVGQRSQHGAGGQ